MANGNGERLTLPDKLGKAVELAQRIGWLGVAGMVCWALQSVVVLAEHPSWDNVAVFFGNMGWVLTTASVLASLKRLKTMTATVGAEGQLARAALSQQLPGPDLHPQSADPAVQREIDKQLVTASGIAPRPPLKG